MAGIFDIKTGAFDSSEAALLHQAYEIALQGLKSSHQVDRALVHRLARSVVKVARSESDCLRNDGTIDPVKLAQRAILRMLQASAPIIDATKERSIEVERQSRLSLRERFSRRPEPPVAKPEAVITPSGESPSKVMLRLFERTPFAKL